MTGREAVLLLAGLVLGLFAAAFALARPDGELPRCECGHDARAHEHNRPGTWCGVCSRYGEDACPAYAPLPRPSWTRPDPEVEASEFLRLLSVASRVQAAT